MYSSKGALAIKCLCQMVLSSVNTNTMPEYQISENQSSAVSPLEQLQETFLQLGYPQLQALQCSVKDGMLKMTGELDSFYLKQVAQSVAIKISGPNFVQNQIKVK